jgi:hypothetical protein
MAARDEVPEGAAVFPLIPAELEIHPLLLSVLHAVVFLDGSSDEIVDPDAAVEQLELIAACLQRLGGDDLRRVREDLDVLLAFGKEQEWSKDALQFLNEFLTNLGVGG